MFPIRVFLIGMFLRKSNRMRIFPTEIFPRKSNKMGVFLTGMFSKVSAHMKSGITFKGIFPMEIFSK